MPRRALGTMHSRVRVRISLSESPLGGEKKLKCSTRSADALGATLRVLVGADV